jgi:hypothetical protein
MKGEECTLARFFISSININLTNIGIIHGGTW